jgi:xanthine dehydrogenase YagT iron-sulfur-binding subunit
MEEAMARTAKRQVVPAAIIAPVTGPGPVPVTLRINGQMYRLSLEPRWSLLDVLRENLGLTGAKRVCNLGECGACTVLLDGRPVYSCITLALECEKHDVTTIEGLAVEGKLDPVQEAFIRCDAVQCGFCTPGQVLAAKALLAQNPHPTDQEIIRAMAGNLCRCGAYPHIFNAIRSLEKADAQVADRIGGAKKMLDPDPSTRRAPRRGGSVSRPGRRGAR